MAKTIENRTMLTDLYQLTMNAAYFENNKNDEAIFELFIRGLPKDWGYFIVNGVEDAVDYSTNIGFEKDDLNYLDSQNIFKPTFLDFLKDFKFEGDIFAIKEGTPITSNTPILQIRAPRTQVQYLESMDLNTINFQTLIASKANRIVNAAYPAKIVDFGLRRAQEKDAAMLGARAAYLAGAVATSNVLAGKEFGIPLSGTHAHSFVMSFPTELEAFRAYTKTFPTNATLLVDTYDTIEGAKNAVIIAKELAEKGMMPNIRIVPSLGAVRLDSGNLADLSKKVRKIFDDEGLNSIKIFVSNDLNEYKIFNLREEGARIDGYGVGTEMITAKPVSAISGVYKIVEDEAGAKIKLSEGKKTYPGRKQVYRIADENGFYSHDILALESEDLLGRPLLEKVVENGKRIRPRRNLDDIRTYCLEEVAKLPASVREVYVKNPYELKISEGLQSLFSELSNKHYGGQKI